MGLQGKEVDEDRQTNHYQLLPYLVWFYEYSVASPVR